MLTKKQLQLLEFIQTRLQKDGIPPSFDEMKVALDLRSKSGIHRLITALEERGFIRRLAHRARAIEVIRMPENFVGTQAQPSQSMPSGSTASIDRLGTPSRGSGSSAGTASANHDSIPANASGVTQVALVGRIAAGVPIEAINQATAHMAVPDAMLSSGGQHYALEVRGDSMIEAGINDGDVVVIRETGVADNGDIVVAMVEGHEATLKRYKRKGDMVELEAANPAYPTRVLPVGQIEIQGRLVGLIRTY